MGHKRVIEEGGLVELEEGKDPTQRPATLLRPAILVCTDLAAASTAAAAATMGSFTYKWKLPITRCWPHLFQRTDRQAGEASASELPNYFKLPHFHLHIRPVRPATMVPAVFSLPSSPCTTSRSGVTLIGSGEFKGPVRGWGCHHPGQQRKETTWLAYHSTTQLCTTSRRHNTVRLV